MLPLVTCIMPTANRREFVRRAIALFMAQDYERKHLIIIEDGEERNADLLLGGDSHSISYDHIGFSKCSIGEKRNIACAQAADGLIAHFDDDDWHSPQRLSTQVKAMHKQNGSVAEAQLCGMDRLVFYNGEAAWLYQSARQPWLAGGTLMYQRSTWEAVGGFGHKSSGEDTAFVDLVARRRFQIATITDPSLYVAMIHGSNTEFRVHDPQWGAFDASTVRRWIGEQQVEAA